MTLRFANAVTLLAMLTWHSMARAEVCRIEATGVDTSPWGDAIASLSDLALTEHDCSSLRIDVAAGRANVLFTTSDGRNAQRAIAMPAELRPTVEALRVEVQPRDRRQARSKRRTWSGPARSCRLGPTRRRCALRCSAARAAAAI